MKFEEVLPKMRDEGRIGKVGGMFFKFENGLLWRKTSECSPWSHFPRIVEDYLTIDTWSLEPIKVKKWQWVFGVRNECRVIPTHRMTEAEAEGYMVVNGFGWAEEIDRTMVEEEL